MVKLIYLEILTMKAIRNTFIFFSLFLTSVSAFTQSQIGITAGVNYIELHSIDPEEFGYGHRYLLPLQAKEKFVPTIGLKFTQKINERFYADYQFRYFFKIFRIDRNPNPLLLPGAAEPNLYNRTRIFVATHSASFSMNLTEKFDAGIGGFLKISGNDPTYFAFLGGYTPNRHAGFLLKSSYKFQNLQFEIRYLKGIGESNGAGTRQDFLAMNTLELSASYMFFTLKKQDKRD